MGRITNSFENQIGRDAGKVASNIIFGDKHSTPYRRVADENARNKTELENRNMSLKEVNAKNQDLYALDAACINAVDQVISIPIPENGKEILSLLNELEIQLEVNKWNNVISSQRAYAQIRNKYPDAVLKKYEQCLNELYYLNVDSNRIKSLKRKIFKYKFKKGFSKYLSLWIPIIVITSIILLINILIKLGF